jgi:hypothetical protein
METTKLKNPAAFPSDNRNEGYYGMTLRDYSQVKFMAAIISNADTMREITKTWNSVNKNSRIEFEELVAKLGMSYANAMLKVREETES